jgi:hypothetical protein
MDEKMSCIGSRYGEPSGRGGLGGSGLGGLAINCSIGHPLADCAANRLIGALLIINPKRDSVAIAEIEFGKVACKWRSSQC